MEINFQNLNFNGAKPTSVPTEICNVVIDTDVMVKDYAIAFVKECQRMDPRRFEQVGLTFDEMISYCNFLVYQRVACVYNSCKEWRALKNLYIPIFIQYSISLIGEVRIQDRGLILRPVYEPASVISLEEAMSISNKISYFKDSVQIRRDAMPRSIDGDLDTMSCALIAKYVQSMKDVDHPVATYIAAFMGFKLQEEQAFHALYRVQYDDLEFIRCALTTNRVVMGNVDKD